MSRGKEARLRRIVDPASGSAVMFAFSHGTSAPEVLPGLERPGEMLGAAARGGATCGFIAPGLFNDQTLAAVRDVPAFGLVAKITASASRGEKAHQEVLTASVERALEIGADGVVAMIPFAPENEPDVIRLVGELGESCARWGMPFIAEAEFPNAYHGDQDYAESWGLPYLKRSARLCVELGADIVKSNWPGSGDAFAEIVDCANAPVVVAGGSRISDLDLLERLVEAREAGAIGCSVGRNIFQHEYPERMVRAIAAVFRDRRTAADAHDHELQPIKDAS